MMAQQSDVTLPSPGQTVTVQGRRFLVCRANTDLDTYYNDEPAKLTVTYYLVESSSSEMDQLLLRELL